MSEERREGMYMYMDVTQEKALRYRKEAYTLSQSLTHLSVFSESVVSAVSDSLSANKMHTPQLAYCTHSTFRVYCHHPHKNKFHKFNVYVC